MGIDLEDKSKSEKVQDQLTLEGLYRRGIPRAVDDVGCHGRLMQHDTTTRAVHYCIEHTAPNQVGRVDRATVRKTYSRIGAKRSSKMPFRSSFALLSQKEDVIFWKRVSMMKSWRLEWQGLDLELCGMMSTNGEKVKIGVLLGQRDWPDALWEIEAWGWRAKCLS